MKIKRVTVKKNERGLLLRNGDFERVLQPGTHWLFAGLDTLRVELFALEQSAFTHGLADYLMAKEPEVVAAEFVRVELTENQVGLRTENGVLAEVLAPATRRLYWKGLVDVQVEVIDLAPSAELPAGSASQAAKGKRSGPVLIKGNDQLLKLPATRNLVVSDDKGVGLRFEKAPVTEVIHFIMGDLLKLDYAIVPPLSGDITLHTQGAVPKDQLLGILESLLLNNGIVMVPDVNGRYRIGKAETMKSAVPVPRRADSNLPGYGSVIIPLQHIGAAEMADILRPVAGPEAFVRVDVLRNVLVLVGSRNQVGDGVLVVVDGFEDGVHDNGSG